MKRELNDVQSQLNLSVVEKVIVPKSITRLQSRRYPHDRQKESGAYDGIGINQFLFSYGWGLHLRNYEKQTAFYRRKSHYRYGLGRFTSMATAPHKHKELIEEFFRWLNSDELVKEP